MFRNIKLITDVVLLILLLSAFTLLTFRSLRPRSIGIFIVSSGSMAPAVPTGSLVFTRPQHTYQVGDIVTFYTGSDQKSTATHRIVGLADGFIRTAGDANSQPDFGLTPVSRIIGKTAIYLPCLGYLAAFAKTPWGFILLVIIPATLIVYEEIKSFFSEIRKHLPDIIHKSSFINHKSLYFFIFIPVLFSGFIFFSFSGSYYKDTQTSTGNSFTAWIPTPSPSPDPGLVEVFINEFSPRGSAGVEWVELYNPSPSPVDINGWKIADENAHSKNKDEVLSAALPLPSHGYAVIVGNTNTTTSISPQAVTIILGSSDIGSGLNEDGDTIYLSDSTGQLLDSASYSALPAIGKSFARHPDGGEWQNNVTPSIGTADP